MEYPLIPNEIRIVFLIFVTYNDIPEIFFRYKLSTKNTLKMQSVIITDTFLNVNKHFPQF